DQRELAQIINALAARPMAYGPYPGESLMIDDGQIQVGKVSWIALDETRHAMLKAQLVTFLHRSDPRPAPIQPLLGVRQSDTEIQADLLKVEEFLPELAR